MKEQAKSRIDFEFKLLQAANGYPWDDEIATMCLPGGFMTEIEFFHRATGTLVLTDLIENIEPEKVGRVFWQLLTWIGGVSAPYGGLPRDLRLTFTRRHRRELRAAVETMLQWNPERVVFAHGRWYESDGAAALRRAFGWLLRDASPRS